MKTQQLLIGLVVLLAGCAGLAPTERKAEAPAPEMAPTEPEARLPAVELTPELLYRLLVAEVAGQRGALDISAEQYLIAAQETRDPRVAQRATHVAAYSRQYLLALQAARLWVELAPESLKARHSLAALLIRQNRSEEALEHLEKVLSAGSQESGEAFILIANLLGREQDRERALEVMRQLLAPRPDNPNALHAYAHLATLAEQYDLALETVERALEIKPDLFPALVLKADLLRRTGQPDAALEVYRQAVAQQPDEHNVRLNYARLLVERGHFDEARKQFTQLRQQLPGNSDIIFAQGLLAMQAGALEEAEERFHELLDLGQRTNAAAFSLGQIADARGESGEAIRWYSAVSRGTSYLDARIRVATLLLQERGIEAARQHLHQTETEADAERLRLYLAEGELLREAGDPQTAVEVYSEGLQTLDGRPELYYARAMTYEQLGRIDLLEQDLRAILAQDPENAQALNALGYTLADRTDRYAEAHDYIKRALAQEPEDAAILDSMGWVLYRMERYPEALDHLRRAYDRQPDPEIAAHLGEVLWASGERRAARKVWRDAERRWPDHPLLRETLERFDP